MLKLPGVGTIAEAVPGYDAGMWYGLFAPKGTPAAVVRQLEQVVAQVLAQPQVAEKLAGVGIEPASGPFNGADVAQRIQERNRPLARRGGAHRQLCQLNEGPEA